MDLNEILDIGLLEDEVRNSVERDRIYLVRNEAKIRAATDSHLRGYDEFRNRVKAAHLKPLEKQDKFEKKDFLKTVWNPANKKFDSMADQISPDEELPSGCGLQDRLNRLTDPTSRYLFLKEVGAGEVSRCFRKEVPVGALGSIAEALSTFPNTTQDILFVVSVLETLTKTERFRLSLDFLTCTEKDTVWSLIDRISKSFTNRHQDLADAGVTEWTVEALREIYSVAGKKLQD